MNAPASLPFARYTRAIVIACATLAWAGTAAPAPQITTPSDTFDFGERDNSEKVDAEFTLRNTGDETLQITNVKSSCGCTVAELAPEDQQVEPGEEVPIRATFNLAGRSGQQTKYVSVTSNDPETPLLQLKITGTAIAPVYAEPRSLALGQVEEGADVSSEFTVRAGRPDVNFKVRDVQSTNPAFSAEVEPIEEGKAYRVTFQNTGELASGFQSLGFRVMTDHPESPQVQVAGSLQVVGPVSVNPKRLALLSSSDPVRMYTMRINVTPGLHKEFNITEVQVPDDRIKPDVSPRAGGGYEVKLVDVPAVPALDAQEIVIKTDLDARPELRVPFKIIQRPNTAALR